MSRVLYPLAVAACVAVSACGTASPSTNRAASEVRGLFATFAADGRAQRFAAMCQDEMTGVLRQLLYVVGAKCPKALAEEWAEGVQLTKVTRSTPVAIRGDRATVFDGPVPGRALRVAGHWLIAEMPRNARHARSNEAELMLAQIDAGARARHEPTVNPETGALQLR